jgi:hypothetical protein
VETWYNNATIRWQTFREDKMSTTTTNILRDISVDRIERIKVTRRGPRTRMFVDRFEKAYFLQVHGNAAVRWDSELAAWTSCEGNESYVCFVVELKL